MNPIPDPERAREGDDPVRDTLRRYFDESVVELRPEPDPGDVHRRLRRRDRRRRVIVAAAAAAVVVVVVGAVVGRSDTKGVTMAGRVETLAQRRERLLAEAMDLAGGRPDVLAANNRTTSDGKLRLRALLVDTSRNPRTPALRSIPAKCRDTQVADVIAVFPDASYTGVRLNLPEPSEGAVTVAYSYLAESAPAGDGMTLPPPTIPDGRTDPRIVGKPLPDGARTPPSSDIRGAAVVARGERLRSVSVVFPSGRTDAGDALGGFAVAGAWDLQTPPGSRLMGYEPQSIVLTFDDGHSVEVGTARGYGTARTFASDGSPAQSILGVAALTTGCKELPVTLPPAGEQPKDAAAAKAAVTHTVEMAAQGSLPIEERLTAYLDQERGRRIIEELGASKIAAASMSTATVLGMVFVSPTEAIVQFDVHVPSEIDHQTISDSQVKGIFGKVVLRDGKWLVTSETICKVVGIITPKACGTMANDAYYPREVYYDE